MLIEFVFFHHSFSEAPRRSGIFKVACITEINSTTRKNQIFIDFSKELYFPIGFPEFRDRRFGNDVFRQQK